MDHPWERSYYTEPTTGLKVIILINNGFHEWMEDIRLVAESKGIWALISPGSLAKVDRETILKQPIEPTKPLPPDFKPDDRWGLLSPEAMKIRKADFNHSTNIYQNDVAEYRVRLDAYNVQQKRLREARTLLLASVYSRIREAVRESGLPCEIMAKIRARCGVDDGYVCSDDTKSQTTSGTATPLISMTESAPSPTFSTNSSIWSETTLKD